MALIVFLAAMTAQTREMKLLQIINRYREVDEIHIVAGGKTRLVVPVDQTSALKSDLKPQAILKGYSQLLSDVSTPTGIEMHFYINGTLLFTEELLCVGSELPGCFELNGSYYVVKVDGAYRELRPQDEAAMEAMLSGVLA